MKIPWAKKKKKPFKQRIPEYLLIYTVFVVFIIFSQRHFLYFPDENLPDISATPWMGLIEVTTEDHLTLTGWWIYPLSKDKPTILMFHGNAQNIEVRAPKVRSLIQQGYGVLLAEYRGYGGNPGKPSEEGFYKDGRAYMEGLTEKLSIPSENIILYGESLGSGIAVQLATEYNVRGIVLEVPFSSILAVARLKFFFVPFKNFLLKDQYLNSKKIKNINIPVFIGVGGKDVVVPNWFGKKLYEAANEPKKLIEYPEAGHNTLYLHGFEEDMLKFIEGI